jgi:predicted Zn-dependent peptidase
MTEKEIYRHCVLSNGIRVVHRHTFSDVAHMGIIINAGSRDEKPTEQGLAHLIEHMIFKGTAKRKAYHVLSCLENVGGEMNAFTTKEDTCLHASFVSTHFERAFELMSDVLFNSSFPVNELKKEKEVVVDEINSYRDNPSDEIFDLFEEKMFGNHPLGHRITGTKESVKKISKGNIKSFIQQHYTADRIVIAAVSNHDFTKVKSLAEEYFSADIRKKSPEGRKRFTRYKPFSDTVRMEIFQAHCMIGNVAYNQRDKHKTALMLLNNFLGGPSMNARLSLEVREKHGFCYNIESNYTPFSDSGLFTIYLGTDNIYMDKAIGLIFKELKKIRDQKLGILQMKRAKQQWMGQIAITYESNLHEMLSMGKSFMVYNKVDTLATINHKIEATTADDLIAIANEVFDPDHLSLLVFQSK